MAGVARQFGEAGGAQYHAVAHVLHLVTRFSNPPQQATHESRRFDRPRAPIHAQRRANASR